MIRRILVLNGSVFAGICFTRAIDLGTPIYLASTVLAVHTVFGIWILGRAK